MNISRIIRCPHCGETFEYQSSPFRPFCSERCKQVDLGHWLEESYRVPSQMPPGYLEEGEGQDDETYTQ